MGSVDAIAKGVAATLEGAKIRTEKGRAFARILDGRVRGVPVRVRCAWTNRVHDWTVETKGAGPVVLLSARRRDFGEQGAIDSGAIVAVATGDEAFDREWLVEGAPAATTRSVVDASIRAALVAAGDVEIEVDGGNVVASGGGRPYEAAEVVRTVELAAALRERLAVVAREPDGDRALAKREIAELRAKQERVFSRASWPARILMVFGGALLLAALAAGLWYGCVPSF